MMPSSEQQQLFVAVIHLPETLGAWGAPEFDAILKADIAKLNPDLFPLQQGLSQGSYALREDLNFIIISSQDRPGSIRIRVGIHYRGVIAGCSCADDPTPVDETVEYCEVELDIDRRTAETTIRLLPE